MACQRGTQIAFRDSLAWPCIKYGDLKAASKDLQSTSGVKRSHQGADQARKPYFAFCRAI